MGKYKDFIPCSPIFAFHFPKNLAAVPFFTDATYAYLRIHMGMKMASGIFPRFHAPADASRTTNEEDVRFIVLLEGHDFIRRTGLIPPTEVPSLGSMEASCRLRVMPVMPVMVSQPAGAKTDQRDETSTQQDAGCRQRHQH